MARRRRGRSPFAFWRTEATKRLSGNGYWQPPPGTPASTRPRPLGLTPVAAIAFAFRSRPGLGERDALELAELLEQRPNAAAIRLARTIRAQATRDANREISEDIELDHNEATLLANVLAERGWPDDKPAFAHLRDELKRHRRPPQTGLIRSVHTDMKIEPEELAEVGAVFRAAGFDVNVHPKYDTRSGPIVPWLIGITLTAPMSAFLTTLAARAADDAYPGVKAFFIGLWHARRRPEGSVVVEDPDGTHVVLVTAVAEHAIDALADIDWTTKRGHYLIWDEARQQWLDPTRPERS
jgi:hypothetical protein